MPRTILRRLLLIGFGVALGLVAGEVVVRCLGLGEKGSVGVLYEPDARLGWRHRSHVEFVHGSAEYTITWRLNGDGLRRDGEVDLGAERARWLVLGDSHAAGHGVEGPATFASRLEALASPGDARLDVLNLGVDGYTTSQEYLALEPALDRFAPAAVVLAVYPANDVRENLTPLGLGAFPRPMLDASLRVLPASSPPAGAANEEPRGVVRHVKDALSASSKLYAFIGDRIRGSRLHELLARVGLMRRPPDDLRRRVVLHCQGCHGQLLWGIAAFAGRSTETETAVERTANIIDRMHALCRERKVQFVAVVIPARLEVEGDPGRVDEAAAWMGMNEKPLVTMARLRTTLTASLAARQIPVLDLLPAARARKVADPGTALYFPEDWHLNPAGHAFVAEELLAYVAEQGWIGP